MREGRSNGNSVIVDAEGELIDLVRCGKNQDSDQAEGTGLQRDRRRRSPLGKQKTLCKEGASATVFGHDESCPSTNAITEVVSGRHWREAQRGLRSLRGQIPWV